MIGPLTYLDAALIAICLISGLLAMYRGVTREVLSIVSWLVAAGAVLYFVLKQKTFAAEMAKTMGTKVEIAQVAVGAVIFLIVLVIVHLITARISDAILDSRVGMIDRVLGFVFGVVRGLLIVVIVFSFADWFFFSSYLLYGKAAKPAVLPPWVENALSRKLLSDVGRGLTDFLSAKMQQFGTPPPAAGEQQGRLDAVIRFDLALAKHPTLHISVTSRDGAG
jgi:membrane protein required for colicin V production